MSQKVRVLVVGGGGREHTLVWKLVQSPRVEKVICTPGNAGIAALAETLPVAAEDIAGLVQVARQARVDFTIVGPEAPLVQGITDAFQEAGLRVFGPSRQAAMLEGSKAFAKDLMRRYQVPTADYRVFREPEPAYEYIRSLNRPCVVKADGLAAGKGVTVATEPEEALEAVRLIMEDRIFGEAGRQLVVEELLEGEEVSILAFTDGKTVVPMVSAQDHKRIFDGDRGPNTGGMGAYSPAPVYTAAIHQEVMAKILQPVVAAMANEGCAYSGVLYAGLMITAEGPKVLEFNARLGDPETQVVLPRLKTDLIEIIEAVINGRLDQQSVEWLPGAAVCVVLASEGYPGAYGKGYAISGLDQLPSGTMAFHAGTDCRNGQLVTAGGRVLGITALGDDIRGAIDRAYAAADLVQYQGCYYRRDIGYRALQR